MSGAYLHIRVIDGIPGEEHRTTDIPPWFGLDAWGSGRRVQASYVRNKRPYSIRAPAVAATVHGRQVDVERAVVVYGHLGLTELYAFLPDPGPGDYSESGVLVDASTFPAADRELDASQPNGLAWICDMTFHELTGTRVVVLDEDGTWDGDRPPPYRTDGVVKFVDAIPGESAPLLPRFAELTAQGSPVPTSIGEAGDLAVAAALAVRARHLVGRLQRRIDLGVTLMSDREPWTAMKVVAAIQEEALKMRSEITGRSAYFLGSFETQRLYKRIERDFGIPSGDLQALEQSLDDLQAYSATLLGLGVDRSQWRFGVYGLLFAFFSLSFGSIAVLDLTGSEPKGSTEWVAVALAAVVAMFLLTMLVLSFRHGRAAALVDRLRNGERRRRRR